MPEAKKKWFLIESPADTAPMGAIPVSTGDLAQATLMGVERLGTELANASHEVYMNPRVSASAERVDAAIRAYRESMPGRLEFLGRLIDSMA